MAKVSYIRESTREIENEIRKKIEDDPTIGIKVKAFALEVRDYWRSISPIMTGEYAASVEVRRRPERAFKKLPQYWVGTRLWYAHFIEYGTGNDSKGGWRFIPRLGRMVGELTPTPEFAPAARTAHHFSGTPDSGAENIGEEIA